MGNRHNTPPNARSSAHLSARANTPRRQSRPQATPRHHGLAWLGITAIVLLLTAATYLHLVPHILPAIYAVFSLGAFIAYAIDKSAARNGRWRTPENTLHLLAVIGGWPGALLAQSVLRHKSKKRPFQVVFWLTVLLNCGALGWMVWLQLHATV